IRYRTVTGVRTCALPISTPLHFLHRRTFVNPVFVRGFSYMNAGAVTLALVLAGCAHAAGVRYTFTPCNPGFQAAVIACFYEAGIDRKSTRLNSSHRTISY